MRRRRKVESAIQPQKLFNLGVTWARITGTSRLLAGAGSGHVCPGRCDAGRRPWLNARTTPATVEEASGRVIDFDVSVVVARVAATAQQIYSNCRSVMHPLLRVVAVFMLT